jgi:hypothetical protein
LFPPVAAAAAAEQGAEQGAERVSSLLLLFLEDMIRNF